MIEVDKSTAYTVAFSYLTSITLDIMSTTMQAIADTTDTWLYVTGYTMELQGQTVP